MYKSLKLIIIGNKKIKFIFIRKTKFSSILQTKAVAGFILSSECGSGEKHCSHVVGITREVTPTAIGSHSSTVVLLLVHNTQAQSIVIRTDGILARKSLPSDQLFSVSAKNAVSSCNRVSRRLT